MTDTSWDAWHAVQAGIVKVQHTTDLAAADIPFSQARIDTAAQMSASLAATKTAITAWVPSSTYKASDLLAIKTQLSLIIDQLSNISLALGELYLYRKVNDQNVIDVNDALVWIAKQSLGGSQPDQ